MSNQLVPRCNAASVGAPARPDAASGVGGLPAAPSTEPEPDAVRPSMKVPSGSTV